MKRILASLSLVLASLPFTGCGGNGSGSSAPTLSGPGFFVYTVYGSPGVSSPDPGVQITGNVVYPQSCQLGSSGCNISFNTTTDPQNGTFTFPTLDIPDTWSFTRRGDYNCPGGAANVISYPGYLVGYAGESVILNCDSSVVYSAHLLTPTVYVGYQQTPPSQLTIYSDQAGLFGRNAVTVRSYNVSGNLEDQLSGTPAPGGSAINVPFDSTLSAPGYHMLALPSSGSTSTYAAAVTLQTVQLTKGGGGNPCQTHPNCANPN